MKRCITGSKLQVTLNVQWEALSVNPVKIQGRCEYRGLCIQRTLLCRGLRLGCSECQSQTFSGYVCGTISSLDLNSPPWPARRSPGSAFAFCIWTHSCFSFIIHHPIPTLCDHGLRSSLAIFCLCSSALDRNCHPRERTGPGQAGPNSGSATY